VFDTATLTIRFFVLFSQCFANNNEDGDPTMANRENSENFGNLKFANISMREDEKNQFMDWYAVARDDIDEWLSQLIDDSYRLTLKFNYNDRCYQTSVTQQDTKHENFGSCMVTRAGSVEEVILLTLWKIFVLCEGGEWPSEQQRSLWG